jgi:hypothetical protein
MIEYAEKRDFLRMPIDCELSFSAVDGGKRLQGKVINLSSKGILFTSGESFDIGTRLDIVLTPSNSITPPMRARVTVSRVVAREVLFDIACEIDDVNS